MPPPTPTPLPPGWRKISSLPTERYHFTANIVEGLVYVIGGYGDQQMVVEIYDPATDSWTSGASPGRGRAAHASCVLDGNIYVFGGDEGFNWHNGAEKYDPLTNTWTTIAAVPPEIEHGTGLHTCAAVNGKIYLMGGLGSDLNLVRAYNPTTDTWEDRSPLLIGRISPASVTVGGKILVIGGCGAQNSCDTPLDAVEEYDPATDTWTMKAPLPTARRLHTAVVLNGSVYILGGFIDDDLPTVEVYDLAANTWRTLQDMPIGQSKFASIVVGDVIIVLGLRGNYIFDPAPASND